MQPELISGKSIAQKYGCSVWGPSFMANFDMGVPRSDHLFIKAICHHGQKIPIDKIEIQSFTGLTKKYIYDKM